MTKFHKTFFYTLIVFICFTACEQSKFSNTDFEKLVKENGVMITDTFTFPNSVILRVYKDYGLGGKSYNLFHKKGSNYYYKLDKQSKNTSVQIWKSYILQTCSYMGEASDSGQWVRIENKITSENKKEVHFDYRKEILPNKESGYIFKFVNGNLTLFGKLSDYCSLHNLDSGLYYLTPPGIFYIDKTDITELEIKYR